MTISPAVAERKPVMPNRRWHIFIPLVAALLLGLLFWTRSRPRVVQRPLHTLQLAGDAWGVRFSPDGKTLAVGSSDGAISLMDVPTGQVRRTLRGPGEGIYFSHDGTVMYALGRADSNRDDVSLKEWNTATWRVTRGLPIHDFPIATSPDFQTLVVPAPKASAFQVWNSTTGQVAHTLPVPGKPAYILSADLSADGKTLVVGCNDGTVELWDTSRWHLLRSWKYSVDNMEPVAFSPDGRTLAVGGGRNRVDLLDAVTGRTEHTLSVETDVPCSLIFSPDSSHLVTKGFDDVQTPTGEQWQSNKRVKLWDVQSGRGITTLEGLDSGGPVVFSHDGKWLVTGDAQTALWGTATGRELCRFVMEDEHGPVLAIALSPDQMLLADGSAYGTVRLWRIPTR